ncbi:MULTISPECIES: TonB-dependent receptor [unclassified Pseudomonas]|uniref:TonB-dependent receptor n=1 Tax=unclassified Pseudomonas TaxID=196821 RepID=UPI002446C6D5|nr:MULTISPECIES: TonB-dependent receptor [unclassified Pseudomonas]MDG9928323.1 TonB-dependent receptor [Pseudomonas sp. GD04042]MDH0481113.1 TonB-dependent receptor [Pseudomonas sp. GD04015]MDH0604449.1 TonB-dependent receptor [Pseudomonas sp. GD03869]
MSHLRTPQTLASPLSLPRSRLLSPRRLVAPEYALTLLLALAAPGHVLAEEAAAAPGVATPGAEEDVALGKVTVTARRREENVQDVPTPITTLSGATLEQQKVYKVQDLQQVLPSVNVAYIHARQSSVAVRGIGNNPASDGLEGSAGIYLDNIYLGRPGMAVFDLLDVEQLELLRGPQGTLFGKNTTAGVINISTRKPTFTPERSVEITGGERGLFQGKGTVSGPLTETLAGRLSLYRTRDDGYIDNRHDDRTFVGGEREGARGQLLFEPNDDFSLRWITDYNQENSTNGVWALYGVTDRFRERAALIGGNPQYDPKKREVNINGAQSVNVYQGGSSLEANWNLDGGYTFTSISGYRYWHFIPRNDVDFTEVDAFIHSGVEVHDRQFSQEFRLASPTGGSFDYVVGAYLFNQNLGNKTEQDFGPYADPFLTGANLGIFNNTRTQTNGKIETDSFALFGQANWHLSDRLDLTVGVRGTYEEKTARLHRFAPDGGAALPPALDAIRQRQMGALDTGDFGLHNAAPSGLVSLSYRFSDDLLGYASLAHGEKSGGVNLVAPVAGFGADSLVVGPERANDAELGFKSTLDDGRLLFNANLFWTGIHGYQATTLTTPAGSLTPVSVLANAGSVRSRGVEFEASYRPLRGLTLNFNGSYNDVTYLSFENAPCPGEVNTVNPNAVCDLTGERVVGASKWIGNANGEYTWQLDGGLRPYVNAGYSYRSEAEGTLDNSDLSKIDGYGLLNLAAGVRADLGDGELDASLWVRNATDEDYYLTAFAMANGAYTASVGQPRTAGLTLRYDF